MAVQTGGTVKQIQHDLGGIHTVTVTYPEPTGDVEYDFPPQPEEFLKDFENAKTGKDTVDVTDDGQTPPSIIRVVRR